FGNVGLEWTQRYGSMQSPKISTFKDSTVTLSSSACSTSAMIGVMLESRAITFSQEKNDSERTRDSAAYAWRITFRVNFAYRRFCTFRRIQYSGTSCSAQCLATRQQLARRNWRQLFLSANGRTRRLHQSHWRQ